MRHHTDRPDAAMKRIATTAFGYTGRTFEIRTATTFNPNDNHWSGGSRTYLAAVDRKSMQIVNLPQRGTMFDPDAPSAVEIPPGTLIAQHVIFCGKDLGVRFLVRPEEAAGLIPETPAKLDSMQYLVLAYTRGRKSSYNGRNRMQMAQHDVSNTYTGRRLRTFAPDKWEEAKAALIAQGLLNKAGAITTTGKNTLEAMHDGDGYWDHCRSAAKRVREELN